MDRLLNYFFGLILIYVFALWAPASIHGVIIIGAVAAFIFCSVAFVLGWLTLDGAASAMVIGTIAFGFGGWPTVTLLICFFISSTLISLKEKEQGTVRRDGRQVWANGFWLVSWLVIGIITNFIVCWMAAVAVLATATADTWATELGSRRFNAKTYLITTLQSVAPGTDGGISWPGVVASVAGSVFIALIAYFGFSLSPAGFSVIAAAGLAGSLLDSYMGATIQGTDYRLKIPGLTWKKNITIDNNMVNWAATGLGSLLLIILNQIFI